MGRERWLVLGAFGVVYFVWGSTYLANAWAIETIPPFLMCGTRFLVAGALLFTFTLRMGGPWPTFRQWANAGLIGMLFLTIGTASTVWALQFIPSSLAALVVSFNPLLIMLLMWGLIGNKPGNKAFLGAGISIVGVCLLVGQPQLSGDSATYKGLLAIGIALLSWGLASIYTSRIDMGKNQVRATSMQMLIGGFLIIVISFLTGEYRDWSPSMMNSRSVLSLIYLVFFGSILAFSAFNFLLLRVSPEKVATSNYVNPVVALLLGGWLNNELVTSQSLLAGGIMLTGVYFINSAK
jgi:drug/metabolite transporter (DMT)-like permease